MKNHNWDKNVLKIIDMFDLFIRRGDGLSGLTGRPGILLAVIVFSFGLSSCTKAVPMEGSETVPVESRTESLPESDSLVRFGVREVPFVKVGVETKTAVVTSLSSFYACVSVPSNGKDLQVYTNREFTLSDGDYISDIFWPRGRSNWQFDCANAELDWTSGGFEVTVDNSFDLVVARMPAPQMCVKNTLVFEHAFARIDDVVITAKTGWTLSGVSLYITPVVSGTYNLKKGDGMSDGTGWTWSAPGDLGSETNIAPSTAGTSHPGLLLVPGTYTVRAGWTATDGVDTVSFSDMIDEITVVGGMNNVISMTLGDEL